MDAVTEKAIELFNDFESMYNNYTGRDFRFLEIVNSSLLNAVAMPLVYDNSQYKTEESIRNFIGFLGPINHHPTLEIHVRSFYDFYRGICFDTDYFDFLDLAARIYSSFHTTRADLQNFTKDKLPECSKEETGLIDLISGFNFFECFEDLEIFNNSNIFYLVDKSIFTSQCLRYQIQKKCLNNVLAINKDVMELTSSDFDKEIEVIRVKNPFMYIDNFMDCVTKLDGLLISGGYFCFQEEVHTNQIRISGYRGIMHYFRKKGWTIKIVLNKNKQVNPFIYDSIYIIKP